MADPPVNSFFTRLNYEVRVQIYAYLEIPGKCARGFILSCRQAYDESVLETKSRLLRLKTEFEKNTGSEATLSDFSAATSLAQLRNVRIDILYSSLNNHNNRCGAFRAGFDVLWRSLLELNLDSLVIMVNGSDDGIYQKWSPSIVPENIFSTALVGSFRERMSRWVRENDLVYETNGLTPPPFKHVTIAWDFRHGGRNDERCLSGSCWAYVGKHCVSRCYWLRTYQRGMTGQLVWTAEERHGIEMGTSTICFLPRLAHTDDEVLVTCSKKGLQIPAQFGQILTLKPTIHVPTRNRLANEATRQKCGFKTFLPQRRKDKEANREQEQFHR
ncbi:uncharacterized protein EI97DRAFT_436732 [Westerdykella ornata]|uniref:Uncharacterized protein n=1 Tax=Westerdykella ornata TaxID=318751 RepID=A0A6A6J9I5_WESOR|nr:uncharacterized protein EI97DRAFT_436732 [Westerdykella ornata]KAF2272648.1 hypothetical protein EI97DRAFT_436732 [Westerdykella ornata]